MLKLKPIKHESIPRALSKAERYRLLNEPVEAESICRDVLAIDPENQDALVCLILSLTDMFAGPQAEVEDARFLVGRLSSEFHRAYYGGVVEERWGKAMMIAGRPPTSVHRRLRAAMQHYEAAQSLAPAGNDDAVLRWNACVRILARGGPAAEVSVEGWDESFDDDMPPR